MRCVRTLSLCAAVLVVAAVKDTWAQPAGGPHDIRALGGSTALMGTPVPTIGALRTRLKNPRTAAQVRTVLTQAGLAGLATEVLMTVENASEVYQGGLCTDATPQSGTVIECEVRPGETLQWMAFRRQGEPVVLRDVRWAGRQPFRAFLFAVPDGERVHTFIVPKDCGNLSLLRSADRPAPAAALAPAPPPPPPAPEPAPAPAPPPPPPPAASVQAEQPPATPPPPAAADDVTTVERVRLVADGLFGKERRLRPFDDDVVAPAGVDEFGQCAPLLGVKVGAAYRWANNWELAGLAGVAFSLVDPDEKVREHQLFIDLEANRYFANDAFIGAGLSLWDVTRSDTFTPAALVHVGLPLNPHGRIPVHFLVEGRLFFDGIDEIDNNYQFWGGLRVRF